MKTDVVLAMDEYLDACCGVPKHINPPARDACHIPITTEDHVDLHKEHGCRCDRWGHPYDVWLEPKPQKRAARFTKSPEVRH